MATVKLKGLMSREMTENISYFSLTSGGSLLALRLRDRFGGTAHLPRCHSLGCGHCTPFDSLAQALPERFHAGDTLICITAAGIVFRLLAPHIGSKHNDPAVIVLDEEGRYVIPLLGGHAAGANQMARQIADFLGGQAAVTTASDVQGLIAPDEVAHLLDARVADSLDIRKVTAQLVDGKRVCIEASDDPKIDGYTWVSPGESLAGYGARLLVSHKLANSGTQYLFPETDLGNEYCAPGFSIPTAQLIPRVVTAGVGCKRGVSAAEIVDAVEKTCTAAGIDARAVAVLASIHLKEDEPGLAEAAQQLGAGLVFYSAGQLAVLDRPGSSFVLEKTGTPAVSEPAALLAAGEGAELAAPKTVHGRVTVALAVPADQGKILGFAQDDKKVFHDERNDCAAPLSLSFRRSEATEESAFPAIPGCVFVVGTGAGTADLLTGEAARAISAADVVVGYRTYIEQLRPIFPEKEYRAGSMGKEIDRCQEALDLAGAGKKVAMVSSGDPGVYGMAGPLLSLANGIPVHIIPGVTSAQIAAALLGAPLMNDYVTLSLSDLLTPRDEVIRRTVTAAASDLAVCIYNPTSRKRRPLFEEACALFLKHRPPDTPVGWVRDAGGPEEEARVINLDQLDKQETDMRTIIIVGNSRTEVKGGKMITARGYREGG